MKVMFLFICTFCTFFLRAEDIGSFIANEVSKMLDQDQELRIQLISTTDPSLKEEIKKKIRFQEMSHTQSLKDILASYNLPYDEIPVILNLVLRSSDLNFQKEALEKILAIEERPNTELIPQLIDRILLRQNLPQQYGTHLYIMDETFHPYPIENLENANVLRNKFELLPLETYIQKTKDIIHAIKHRDEEYQSKLIFNQDHNFYGNPDDYLYFASIGSEKVFYTEITDLYKYPPNSFIWPWNDVENWVDESTNVSTAIAFGHPAHAAIYALRTLGWEYELKEPDKSDEDYEEDEDCLIYYRVPDDEEIPFLANYPYLFSENCCSIFMVPRNKFQVHPYQDALFNQFFISSENVKASAKIVCSTVQYPLLMLGKSVMFENSESYTKLKRATTFSQSHYCDLLFDITLENEDY